MYYNDHNEGAISQIEGYFNKVCALQAQAGRPQLSDSGTFAEWEEECSSPEEFRQLLAEKEQEAKSWINLFKGDTDSPQID